MADTTIVSAESIESQSGKSGRTGLLAPSGLLAALGVGSCCVLPVVFMSAGLGGAWLSNLFALSAYQPYFIALSIGFLGTGFYYVYRKPKASCNTDASCVAPGSGRLVKGMLWGATILVLAGIVFPYIGQYLLEI